MAFWESCCGKGNECDNCDCGWKTLAIWAGIIVGVGGLITVLVIAFAVVFPPKATADDAVLGRFALAPGSPATNSTISYNATATVSLWNPNIYRAIEYGPLAVAFSFNGSTFDESATILGFEHKARKTATVRVTVGGVAKPIKLTAPGVKEFSAENDTGKFDVEMRLDTVMQYKGRSAKCPLVVICPLQLQLVDPTVAATAFQRTKCTILRAKNECCACFGPYRRFACGFCIGLAIIAAVAVIVVLAVGYGHAAQPRFDVEDASLARFALATSPSAALSYNLTLTLAVRNPNWAMGATFRSLEADYLFDAQRFDRVEVAAPGYVLPARKTVVFRLSSGADAVSVTLGSAGVKAYKKQSDKGVFDIEAALLGEVKYQLHSSWCRLEAKCPLKLQLAGQDGGAVVFQKTSCEVLRSSQRGC
ncbi:hypothetical protein BAE44_0010054 [Dichanthelium oligosanthes]|uniref:Uncharacterized protein n=1 Tax=Dichanthelium oligosanthes TaxID=888268 RepID=A0A1E5VV11_9POAL|nr:hypothetical protein BAE44_0010054 [Dichanthelium oligosanthes]